MIHPVVIGNKIREFRLARNLEQEQVAKTIGFSVTDIDNIEHGDELPSLTILSKLADEFVVPLAYFFRDDVRSFTFTMAAIVRNNMIKHNCSLDRLAKETHIDYSKLNKFMKADQPLSIKELKTIAKVLNIPIKRFVLEVEPYIRHIKYYLEELGVDILTRKKIIRSIYKKLEKCFGITY